MGILKKNICCFMFLDLAHSFYILGKADKNYISANKNNCFAVEIIILLQKIEVVAMFIFSLET